MFCCMFSCNLQDHLHMREVNHESTAAEKNTCSSGCLRQMAQNHYSVSKHTAKMKEIL